MRSLEEWTRYLERQEQALKKRTAGRHEEEKPPVESAKREPVPTPVSQATQVVVEPDPPAGVQSPPAKPQEVRAARSAPRAKSKQARSVTIPDEGGEVAQSSYQAFRETREQLLERLLDPVLTLEEAARVLNVCPTTVRRYTNRNLLRHYRTGGNQRRFKLSDVLEFLEAQGGIIKE